MCSKVLQIAYRPDVVAENTKVWDCVVSIVMLEVTLINDILVCFYLRLLNYFALSVPEKGYFERTR